MLWLDNNVRGSEKGNGVFPNVFGVRRIIHVRSTRTIGSFGDALAVAIEAGTWTGSAAGFWRFAGGRIGGIEWMATAGVGVDLGRDRKGPIEAARGPADPRRAFPPHGIPGLRALIIFGCRTTGIKMDAIRRTPFFRNGLGVSDRLIAGPKRLVGRMSTLTKLDAGLHAGQMHFGAGLHAGLHAGQEYMTRIYRCVGCNPYKHMGAGLLAGLHAGLRRFGAGLHAGLLYINEFLMKNILLCVGSVSG